MHRKPQICYLALLAIFQELLKVCNAVPFASLSGPSLIDVNFKNNNEAGSSANLTRQHDGDVFSANGMSKCNLDTCVGLSSGTAGLYISESKKTGNLKELNDDDDDNRNVCTCRCHSYLSTYREDLGICVDNIRECTLSPFISGSSSEKIPFVFLPLRGQIIYPSREISFPEIHTPICAVTGSQYLTLTGWSDLRNPIDTDFPFRMFRDEGRTFLQWLGEPDLRHKMQGRLILIHLMCRDMAFPANKSSPNESSNVIGKNIFSPCVAFRVNGSPVKYIHNVSEVLFQSETTSNLSAPSDGLSTKEYIVIGICSLLLGLIYVASVFLYLHVKKRKRLCSEPARSSLDDLDNDINYPKNDQVTFGAPFTRTGSSYSVSSINDHRNSQRSHSRSSTANGIKEEMGIVKNNPLLKHFPNLSDHSGFASDLSNSNSDCEDVQSNRIENLKSQTSAVIHPSAVCISEIERSHMLESPPSPTQENECLPEENVSIIEDMGADEKLENMRALVSGTVRKKLYFNPAYFEPQLLLSPPPAAIEFLTKIREVIAIAKYKMATKRYQPSLVMIPEEAQLIGSEKTQNEQSTIVNNSQIAVRRPTFEEECIEILNGTFKNCIANIGDKNNSIQKWLETVSAPNENLNKTIISKICNSTNNINTKENARENATSNTDVEKTEKPIEIKQQEVKQFTKKLSPPKTKPPPIPESAPKIISHSLKPHVIKTIDKPDQNRSPREPPPQVPIIEKPITPISVIRHFDGNNIYTFAETGSEIYNNPKFNHTDSPQLSQKNRLHHTKSSSRKRMEVLDQYSNPQRKDRSHYEILRNMKHMPDMVYEALAKDYSMGMFSSSRPNSQNFNIPTPDYDSTFDKKIKEVYNNTHSTAPSVPTPDYSTLGKKPLRQYQPDSPIYRRKSPQYLIVDYETDSLERTTGTRKCSSSSSPSSNNSSDVSSQPSPSLSTALPLEEEVEIRHTVYDKVEGFRKDGDTNIKKKISKTGAEYEDIRNNINNKMVEPRIKYDTPFRGSMTIEVQHEPLSDFEPSTDSDQFEPDTLDRKPKKHSFCDVKNASAWSEHLKKSKNFVNSTDGKVSYSSLENMTSLPDFSSSTSNKAYDPKNHLVLRSSSSFRSNVETTTNRDKIYIDEKEKNGLESRPSFGSLREIYQSKAQRNVHQRPKLASIDFTTDPGKLLTLEAKHTKRQRQKPDHDITSRIMPPDVVPTSINLPKDDSNNYYDVPKSQKETFNSESTKMLRKNFQGWNTDNFNGEKIRNEENFLSQDDTENTETISNHSESTEITGVSDTQANSEFEDEKKLKNPHKDTTMNTFFNKTNEYSAMYGSMNEMPLTKRLDLRGDYSYNKYLKRKQKIENKNNNILDHSKSGINSSCPTSLIFPERNSIKTVYRVEVNSNTNGMQIAMGLRERAKKSKDLKNAWRKFVSLAASKFSPNSTAKIGPSTKEIEFFDKQLSLTELNDGDEGISSLIEDNSHCSIFDKKPIDVKRTKSDVANEQLKGFRSSSAFSNFYDNRLHGHKQDLDSGYMSADSSEVYNRRCYERYNFKNKSDSDQIIKVDTIEDDLECVEDSVDETESKKFKYELVDCPKEDAKISETNEYFSEEENCNKRLSLTESEDDDGNTTEDLSESGAESVETDSVLFKNIRKKIS